MTTLARRSSTSRTSKGDGPTSGLTLSETYQLSIVDPSTNTFGPASYAWAFTDYGGNTNTATGSTAQYAAYIDEPFTISIARTRATQTDTLTLRERGNELDRSNGLAFVRNLIP